MKFSEFPYQRPNLTQLGKDYRQLSEKVRQARAEEQALEAFWQHEKLLGSINTMSSLAQARYTLNTADEFYREEQEFFDENAPRLEEMVNDFRCALLDSPLRPALEEKLGRLLFVNFEMARKAFSPQIMDLMAQENRLCTRYESLKSAAQIEFGGKTLNLPQLEAYKESGDRTVRRAAYAAEGNYYKEHRPELDEIFDELVQVRTRMARKLGYQNFIELGYLRMNRNCYSRQEVEVFRGEVAGELVPLVRRIKEGQARRIGVEKLKFYDDLAFFPEGNPQPKGTPEEIMAAGRRMYEELSPETAEFIRMMLEKELFDVIARPGKATGGYCTEFSDYKAPFIFSNFNGTSGDVDVLTHEAGHAFAFYQAMQQIEILELRCPTYEACEVHSMSMEFLTEPWYELFMKEDAQRYRQYHLADALCFIPYGTMVDHFQHIVYERPELTPAQRHEQWARLEKIYRPYADFEDLPTFSEGAAWQRQNHIYLDPFYYIDYCLAQTVALEIKALMDRDWKGAWQTYMRYTEQGGRRTFTQMLQKAGIPSPFEKGTLRNVARALAEQL